MIDRSAITAAVEAYCRAQTEKDHAVWQTLFADDVFHEDPVGIRQNRGKDFIVGPFWEEIVRNEVSIWLTDQVIVCGKEALAIMACEIGAQDARRKLAPVVDHFAFSESGQIISLRGFYNIAR